MGGVALLPGVVVIGGLQLVLAVDMLPAPCRPSSSSSFPIHYSVGLVEDIWHVFYAVLPTGGVAMSPGGGMHRGSDVPRGGGLPLDVAASRLPGFESGAGEQRVCGGLGQV